VGKRNRQVTQDCIWRAGNEPPKKPRKLSGDLSAELMAYAIVTKHRYQLVYQTWSLQKVITTVTPLSSAAARLSRTCSLLSAEPSSVAADNLPLHEYERLCSASPSVRDCASDGQAMHTFTRPDKVLIGCAVYTACPSVKVV
jgi:hypothetical protein